MDLLDVARLDQGLFELTREPMDLAAALEDVAQALSFPEKRVAVTAPTSAFEAVTPPPRMYDPGGSVSAAEPPLRSADHASLRPVAPVAPVRPVAPVAPGWPAAPVLPARPV